MNPNLDLLIARKSWLREASIQVWTKAERHAQTDIEQSVLAFLKKQRTDVARELRRIGNESPGLATKPNGAERIIDEAFDPEEWDKRLRTAVGAAVARTIIRGYLAAEAVQRGRRRRFPPVWAKGGPGSGNFGHEGRPGEIGGSASGESSGSASAEQSGGKTEPKPHGRDSPAIKRDEARRLWDDDVSFNAALRSTIHEEVPEDIEPIWSWLTESQQRHVAERLLDEAITRDRERARQARLRGESEKSAIIKQGWSDVPLTDEEERAILSFELPASVTRRVFAHTGEIMAKPYWKDVNETERTRMLWSIQEGIEEGRTLKQIADDIRKDIDADEVRARRIATTEVTGALNSGHLVQAEQGEEAGVSVLKTWVSVGDDKVRDSHVEADGQVVEGSAGLFEVGDFKAPYPGWADLPAEERINCRCLMTAEPILETETAAQHVEAYKAARLKFDPDQPRVPAGSPEGGQWGEGGTNGGGIGQSAVVATEQQMPEKPTQATPFVSRDVPAPKLSARQVRAFNEYSEAIGFDINQALREDANLSDEEAAVAKQLSAAIEKHGTLPHPLETYRAMSWSHKEDHDAFVSQLTEGRTLQLKGFTSTSLDKDFVQREFTGRPGGSLIMEIKAIKGIRMTGKLTQHEEQKELLLNHKSQFRVTGTRKQGDTTVVSLEQIK